jgi:molybdate transport system substrate-binding protein
MIINRPLRMLMLTALVVVAGACKPKPDTQGSTTGAQGEAAGKKHEITLFVAASLRETMQDLGKSFEEKSKVHVLLNLAGSNELARQIIAAPKADLFLSANENWMDSVEKAGRVVAGTRHDLLSNSLVVVAASASQAKMTAPCDMATLPFKNLALGDPEAVPAGKYARQWLGSVQCNGRSLWDIVQPKAAPAPDVRAALALVLADPDLIGIVYKTDYLAYADKLKVIHEVTDGPPIRYVVAQIAEGPGGEDGKAFLDYLSSSDAKGVFEKHGFTVLSPSTATP